MGLLRIAFLFFLVSINSTQLNRFPEERCRFIRDESKAHEDSEVPASIGAVAAAAVNTTAAAAY